MLERDKGSTVEREAGDRRRELVRSGAGGFIESREDDTLLRSVPTVDRNSVVRSYDMLTRDCAGGRSVLWAPANHLKRSLSRSNLCCLCSNTSSSADQQKYQFLN